MGIFGVEFPWETPEGEGFNFPWEEGPVDIGPMNGSNGGPVASPKAQELIDIIRARPSGGAVSPPPPMTGPYVPSAPAPPP